MGAETERTHGELLPALPHFTPHQLTHVQDASDPVHCTTMTTLFVHRTPMHA